MKLELKKADLIYLTFVPLSLVLVKFFIINQVFRESALSNFQYFLLVISVLALMVSGKFLKPNHTKNALADNGFLILNILAIGIGFYLSYSINKTSFALLFVLASGLLYYYRTSLHKNLILNIVIFSFTVSLVFLLPLILDVIPIVTTTNKSVAIFMFKTLLGISIFALLQVLIYELIRNVRSVNKDYNEEVKTIPIVLGKKRALKIVSALAISIGFLVFVWTQHLFFNNKTIVLLILVGSIAPLLLISFKSWELKKFKDLKFIQFLSAWGVYTSALAVIIVFYFYFKR